MAGIAVFSDDPQPAWTIWQIDPINMTGFGTAAFGPWSREAINRKLEAKEQDRNNRDPLMQIRAYFDIGATGAPADPVVDRDRCRAENERPRLLRGASQPLAVHLDRSRGWGKAWVILPHDGAQGDKSCVVTQRAQSAKPALTW